MRRVGAEKSTLENKPMRWTLLVVIVVCGPWLWTGSARGQTGAAPPPAPPAPPASTVAPPPPMESEAPAPSTAAVSQSRRWAIHLPVSFSIVPQLLRGPVLVNLSLSFALSSYAVLQGVDLGGGVSWISGTLQGAQITGGFNFVGGGGSGGQVSGGLNISGGDLLGLQTAGGLNVVLGSMRGVQVSGGLNLVAEHFHGFQATGGMNYVGGDVRGVQVSGGVNIAVGHVHGTQITGGYNHAGSIRGVQIGVINYGGYVRGAQIGVINIAGQVQGPQIGILNIAEKSKAPVGLVNVIKEGQRELTVWASDVTAANVGFKLGGRILYTLVAGAVQPSRCKTRWMLGLGIGGHFRLGRRFFIEADALVWHINEGGWTDDLNLLGQLRVVAGYAIHKHFAVFAGITANVAASNVNKNADLSFVKPRSLQSVGRRTEIWAWPGFVAGFQI